MHDRRGPGLLIAAFAVAMCAAGALFGAARITGVWRSGEYAPALETAGERAAVPKGREIATLAGGCFWALQTEFEELKGVDRVVAGYAGGTTKRPSYEDVCKGRTGHAESIQIVFDPKVISYEELLHIFFTDIDPTTRNRQGNDFGLQYRSVVFCHNAKQQATAGRVIDQITASRLYALPIVTQVVPFSCFYAAEAYHQDYFAHNPNQPYCAQVVAAEVSRFRKMNRRLLKTAS
jgi:peptide-methionine (S)-S-oxide reductase